MRTLPTTVVAVTFLMSACGSGDVTSAARTTPSAPTVPAPTEATSPTVDPTGTVVDDRVVARIDVPSMPRGLKVHQGMVWVAAARSDEVVVIDPASDEVVASVDVGPLPVTMVGDGEHLWVAVLNGDATGRSTELVRLDTDAPAVAERVALEAFHAIPVADGDAWAMASDGTLRRFDLAAGAVTAEVATDPDTVWIGAGEGAVWGATTAGSAWRVDAETLERTHEVDLGTVVPGRSRVVVGGGRFWVAAGGRLVALDAASGERLVDVPRDDDLLVDDLDVVGDDVWLSVVVRDPAGGGRIGVLERIDPDTGEAVDRYRLGPVPSELDIADGTIWIGDQEQRLVYRVPLDPG